MTEITIIIDPEFKSLIPALQDDEYNQLEASILADGCRDAIVIWKDKNILVDGHNRYDICTKHDVEYKTIYRDFADRDAVIVWMINNQFARRNISTYLRAELALRLEDIFKKQANGNLTTSTGGANPQPLTKSTKAEKVHTRKELAKAAETSEDTIRKAKKIKENAPEQVKAQARKGDLSTNRAYQITVALEKLPEKDREKAANLCSDTVEKINILARLYKSMGSPETNGTYQEIVATGGFQYGNDMDKWLDYSKSSIEVISKALKTIADYHKRMIREQRDKDIADAGLEADLAIVESDITPPETQYKHGDIVTIDRHILLCADNLSDIAKSTIQELSAKPSLIFCDPPYNANSAEYDDGLFEWSQDYFADICDIVAVTPGISSIQDFMKRTNMPYQWSTSTYIDNGITRGAIGFGNWIYTAIFSHGSIYRNRQDVYRISINGKQLDSGDKKQKPSHYLAWLFQLFTKEDDWVVDAFGGSGNSAIVAHEQGRNCLSIEKSPETFRQMVLNIKQHIEDSSVGAAA